MSQAPNNHGNSTSRRVPNEYQPEDTCSQIGPMLWLWRIGIVVENKSDIPLRNNFATKAIWINYQMIWYVGLATQKNDSHPIQSSSLSSSVACSSSACSAVACFVSPWCPRFECSPCETSWASRPCELGRQKERVDLWSLGPIKLGRVWANNLAQSDVWKAKITFQYSNIAKTQPVWSSKTVMSRLLISFSGLPLLRLSQISPANRHGGQAFHWHGTNFASFFQRGEWLQLFMSLTISKHSSKLNLQASCCSKVPNAPFHPPEGQKKEVTGHVGPTQGFSSCEDLWSNMKQPIYLGYDSYDKVLEND